MEPPAAHRAQGVFVALAGVLAVSPDAMLLRWMRSLGASSPDVAVAKYIGIIAFMLALGTARGVSGAFEPLPPETLETMTLLDHLTRSLPVISAYGAVVGGHSFLSWKAASVLRVDVLNRFRLLKAAREFVDGGEERVSSGAFYTLVPIRPRWRGERRSLRTFSPGASLRPPPAFNTPRPRRLSTPLLTPFNSTPTFARMERPSGELLPAFAHAFANATVLPAICVAALFGYLSVSFIMLLIRHYGASNTEIVKSTRKMISIGASMLLYPAPWNWSGPTVSSSPAPLSSPVNVYLSMTHLALMNARMRPYVLEVRRGVSVHGGGVVRFVSVETAEARRVGGVDRGDEVMIELTKRRR